MTYNIELIEKVYKDKNITLPFNEFLSALNLEVDLEQERLLAKKKEIESRIEGYHIHPDLDGTLGGTLSLPISEYETFINSNEKLMTTTTTGRRENIWDKDNEMGKHDKFMLLLNEYKDGIYESTGGKLSGEIKIRRISNNETCYSLKAIVSKYSRTIFKFEVLDSFGYDFIRLTTIGELEKTFVGNLMQIEKEVDKNIKSKESGIILHKLLQVNEYLENKHAHTI